MNGSIIKSLCFLMLTFVLTNLSIAQTSPFDVRWYEVSIDPTFVGNSDDSLATQKAIKSYFDNSFNAYWQSDANGINYSLGNVGIGGSTNATYKLLLNGSSSIRRTSTSSVTDNYYLSFTGRSWNVAVGASSYTIQRETNTIFDIKYNAPLNSMTMGASGIGIFNTSPTNALDVTGNMELSGYLNLGTATLGSINDEFVMRNISDKNLYILPLSEIYDNNYDSTRWWSSATTVYPKGFKNVGIGTTNAYEELTIYGDDNIFAKMQSTGSGSDAGFTLENDVQNWYFIVKGDFNNTFRIIDSTYAKVPFVIEPGSPNFLLYLDSIGRVGILKQYPDYSLDVAGYGSFDSSIYLMHTKSSVYEDSIIAINSSREAVTIPIQGIIDSSLLKVEQALDTLYNGWGILHLRYNALEKDTVIVDSAELRQWLTADVLIDSIWKKVGTYISLVDSTDDVGIGTSFPSTKLDVIGGIGSNGDNASLSITNTEGMGLTYTPDIQFQINVYDNNTALNYELSEDGNYPFHLYNGANVDYHMTFGVEKDSMFYKLSEDYLSFLIKETAIKLLDSIYFQPDMSNVPFLKTGEPLGWFLTTQKNTGRLSRSLISNLIDTSLQYLPFDTANHLTEGFGVSPFDYNMTTDATVEIDTNEIATQYYVNSVVRQYIYDPDNRIITTGSEIIGTVDSCDFHDTKVWTLGETVGVPGIDIVATFDSVFHVPNKLTFHGYYEGSPSHSVAIQIWDYEDGDWETYHTLLDRSNFEWIEITIPDPLEHIQNDSCLVRFYHSASGITAHRLYIDYLVLSTFGFGNTADHGLLEGLTDDDHKQYALLAGRDGDELNIDTISSYDDIQIFSKKPIRINASYFEDYGTGSLNLGNDIDNAYFGYGGDLLSISVDPYDDINGMISLSTGLTFYNYTDRKFSNTDHQMLGGLSDYWGRLYTTNITDDSTNVKLKVPVGTSDTMLTINAFTVEKRLIPTLVEIDGDIANEGLLDVADYGTTGAQITSNTSTSPSVTLESQDDNIIIEPDNDTINFTIDMSLDDLDDVVLTDVDAGDMLRFDDNTVNWINFTPAYASLADTSLWQIVGGTTVSLKDTTKYVGVGKSIADYPLDVLGATNIDGTLSADLDSASTDYSVYYDKVTNLFTYDSASVGGTGNINVSDSTWDLTNDTDIKVHPYHTKKNTDPAYAYFYDDLDSIFILKYGYLYNWFAVNDADKITSSDDWVVPTKINWDTLINYCGGTDVAGGKLKETGYTYWDSPNSGATNEYDFNSRGSGSRWDTPAFEVLNLYAYYWSSTEYFGSGYYAWHGYNNDNISAGSAADKNMGMAIRLVNNSTTLSHGESGTYIGNDEKVYRTICIGTQEWLADNLCETKYRNEDLIVEVTDDTEWFALSTGARCSYNNNEDNAFEDYSNVPSYTNELKLDGTLHTTKLKIENPELDYTGFMLTYDLLTKEVRYDVHTVGSDEYVNGLSFNTGDGVLTLGRAVGADLTQDLDGRYLTAEVDSDTTNEIQDLSLTGNTLSLSDDATTVDLSGYLDNAWVGTATSDLNMGDSYDIQNCVDAEITNLTVVNHIQAANTAYIGNKFTAADSAIFADLVFVLDMPSGTKTKQVYIDTTNGLLYQGDATSGTVTGSGTDGYLTNWNGTTAIEDSPLYTDGTKLGLGTTSPTSDFHYVSSSAEFIEDTYSTTNTTSSTFSMRKSNNNTLGSLSRLDNADAIGKLNFFGVYDDGGTPTMATGANAGIFVFATENWTSSTNRGTRIQFRATPNGSGTQAQAFVLNGISGTMRAGIMTTVPDKSLEINSADGNNLRLTYDDADGSAINYTDFTLSSGGDLLITPSGTEIVTNGAFNYGVDAQASDTYVITLSPAPTAYVAGMYIVFKANTGNTTAASVNVNGLGAITIVKRVSTTLETGDIAAGQLCMIVFDGTNFVLMNPLVN